MTWSLPRHDQDDAWLSRLCAELNRLTASTRNPWRVEDWGHCNYVIAHQPDPLLKDDVLLDVLAQAGISNHTDDRGHHVVTVFTDNGAEGTGRAISEVGSFEQVAKWVLSVWPTVISRGTREVRQAREVEERLANPLAQADYLRQQSLRTSTTRPESNDAAAICVHLTEINTTLQWLAEEVRALRTKES